MGAILTDNSADVWAAWLQKRQELLEKIGASAACEARARCPVGTGANAGRLRDSVAYAVSGGELILGSTCAYAPYVELGTHLARAQPFLAPALLAQGALF